MKTKNRIVVSVRGIKECQSPKPRTRVGGESHDYYDPDIEAETI